MEDGNNIADEVVPGLVSRRAHRAYGTNAGSAADSAIATAAAARCGQEVMDMMTVTANRVRHLPASDPAAVLCLLLLLSPLRSCSYSKRAVGGERL